MVITVLTHALATILICALAIWLVGFLPFDSRIKTIARVVVVVIGLVSIVRSLDLLSIPPSSTTRIIE